MMAVSRGKARGILMWKLRRKIGAAIVRANAMLSMDRVAHTGGDAAAAYSRQSRAGVSVLSGGGGQLRLPMLTGSSGMWPLDQRRRDRGLGFMSSALSRSFCLLSSPTFLVACVLVRHSCYMWLRLMLVGVWFGLCWASFSFFDHYIQSSVHPVNRHYLLVYAVENRQLFIFHGGT